MILSISDAARYLDVTRQAVFVAIRNKRLIAEKMGQYNRCKGFARVRTSQIQT